MHQCELVVWTRLPAESTLEFRIESKTVVEITIRWELVMDGVAFPSRGYTKTIDVPSVGCGYCVRGDTGTAPVRRRSSWRTFLSIQD